MCVGVSHQGEGELLHIKRASWKKRGDKKTKKNNTDYLCSRIIYVAQINTPHTSIHW